MREFKFRAWWKDTKRFLDGDEWYMTCSGMKHLHYSVYPYSDDDFIIEQYTGLKDKNGKEIYEGDIVKAYGRVYEVAWFEKDGGWFCFRENDSVYTPLYHLKGEVVGNIHENPELLRRKNEQRDRANSGRRNNRILKERECLS